MSDARPFPLSRRLVPGSRFSWSDVLDVGVCEAYRDDAAVEFVVFTRAMSHEWKMVVRYECNKVA